MNQAILHFLPGGFARDAIFNDFICTFDPLQLHWDVVKKSYYPVLEVITKSESIAPQTLIISCEACGEVRYLDAASDEEAASLFYGFRCKKGCDRSYYSYISIGQIIIGASQNQAVSETILPQKKSTVLHP